MDTAKTIVIASDHNGNEARSYLRTVLKGKGLTVVDLGPWIRNLDFESVKVDYNDYADAVSHAVAYEENALGILICGTGVGMSIAANRHECVQASLVRDAVTARKTREHNASNVLCLGSWTTSKPEMYDIAMAWLGEEFGKGRHEKRVAKLNTPDTETVVLVPGVFELLHGGHIKLLSFARSLGRVVIALNTDKSVFELKGRWPSIGWRERANLLGAITYVDEVVELHDVSAANVIRETGANLVVKGGLPEHESQVRSIDAVPDDVQIKMFPIDHAYSSQELRERIVT